MTDDHWRYNSSKLGGLAFIIGVVLGTAGNILHPREAGLLGATSLDGEAKLIVNNIAIWYPSHTMITLSIPIVVLGYLTL